METLLELKDRLKSFYSKYEIYMMPVLKFVLAFVLFFVINKNIGFMEHLDSLPVILILALLCSILSPNMMVLFAVVLTLLHLYALSKEVFLTGAVLFLILALLYFRFAPKEGYLAVMTPICFVFRIPYVMPLTEGLLFQPYAMFSVVCGTVVYYFLDGVKMNKAVLGGVTEDDTTTSKFAASINQLIGNKEMYLVLAAFLLTMLVVYLIRRMSIDHAWTIAIVVGILMEFSILFAGYMFLAISGKTIALTVGSAVSALIAFALKFLFFHVDYMRIERVQFEDDEYYYYVKAVPKISVTQSKKQVKKFAGKTSAQDHARRERITREQLAKDMDIDRELLK